MSIKIYNAFRVLAPGTLNPFTFVEQLRAELTRVHRDLYVQLLTKLATSAFDRRTMPDPTPDPADKGPFCPITRASAQLRAAREEVERTQMRDPELDLQCDLTLLNDPADPAGALYLRVFTEQEAYLDAVKAMPGVTEFAYWDGVEGPDGVSAQDWQQRWVTWERVLGETLVPATRGLSWQLHPRYSPMPKAASLRELIAAAIPSPFQRARELALTRVPAVVLGEDSKGPLDFRLRPIEVVRAEVDDLARVLEPQLHPLTVDDLFDEIS